MSSLGTNQPSFPPSRRPEPTPPLRRLPSIDSRHLLGQGRELLIRHGESCYRLRLTRADKLILTK